MVGRFDLNAALQLVAPLAVAAETAQKLAVLAAEGSNVPQGNSGLRSGTAPGGDVLAEEAARMSGYIGLGAKS